MISKTILRGGLVAAATLAVTVSAASAAQAHAGQSDGSHRNPGMERMHELHMQGNPGMQRMHQRHMQGNPGMQRMHELHMQDSDGGHSMPMHRHAG